MFKKLITTAFALGLVGSLHAASREYFVEHIYDEDGMPISKVHDYDVYEGKYSFERWFTGPYATGDWLGARSQLEDRGIVPALSYLGNFAANVSGGMSRGAAISSSVNLGLGINLGKLLNSDALSDWSIGHSWVWRFGDSLTKQRLGNAFSVQQNYGSQTIQMQSLFLGYNKRFDNDWALQFKVGRIAAGDDFLTKPIYWLYMSNSIDGNPVGVYKQTKFSAYPGSTWGAFSKLTSPNGQYFKMGVYQINNDIQDNRHGLDFSMTNALGVNANFELGWDFNHDSKGNRHANISVGYVSGWYNAKHISNPNKYSTYNSSIYLQADYMIWNMGLPDRSQSYLIVRDDPRDCYRDLRGLILWGAIQYNPDEDLAEMPLFVTGGLIFNAPFASRPDDVLCFGVSYGKFSNEYDNFKKNSYEIALELNYKLQINRFSFIQPDIQYIINTNGGEHPDALVLGMQFGVIF